MYKNHFDARNKAVLVVLRNVRDVTPLLTIHVGLMLLATPNIGKMLQYSIREFLLTKFKSMLQAFGVPQKRVNLPLIGKNLNLSQFRQEIEKIHNGLMT